MKYENKILDKIYKKPKPIWLKLAEIMAFCNNDIVRFRSDSGALKHSEKLKIIYKFKQYKIDVSSLLTIHRTHLLKKEVDSLYKLFETIINK